MPPCNANAAARDLLRGSLSFQSRLPPSVCLIHSHSSSSRGRAAIRAMPLRRQNGVRPLRSPPSSSSSSKPSGNDAPADAVEEQERRRAEAMRSARERWPSWVPMPPSLSQALEEESRARPQQRKKEEEVELEQIFIPKDSEHHSSRKATQEKRDDGSGSGGVDPGDLFRRMFGQAANRANTGSSRGGDGGGGVPPRFTWQSSPSGRPRPNVSDNRHWIHSPGGRAIAVVCFAGGGFYYFAHLEQVPYTGRRRFRDVTEAEEAEMGKHAFQEVMSQYRGQILPPNHRYSVMARRVATRIIRAAEDLHGLDFADVEQGNASSDPDDTTYARNSVRNTKWQVFVINDPRQTNAFVLPGGQIFVFTGILSVCGGEDGLAAVLGHEVSHKLCNHTAEKTSGVKIVRYLGFALALAGLDWGVSTLALNYLMSLPNSRRLEVEADDLGLKLMSRACFDPREAPKLWSRMAQMESSGVPTIMSTHPQSSSREEALTRALPSAIEIRRRAGCPEKSGMDSFRLSMGLGPLTG